MNPKKPRIMVGHGEGAFPKKSFEHAIRQKHSNISFNAVDIAEIRQDPLLRHLLFKIPHNLAIHQKTNSAVYLRTKADSSIHHQWSHFSSSAMPMYTRRNFYHEAFRTLVPGGKLVVIDGAMCEKEFVNELQKVGFKVTSKRMSLQEIQKLGTEEALNTVVNISGILQNNETIPKAKMKQIKQGWINLQLTKESKQTPEVVAQIERMADNVEKNLSDKPCTRIIATKPRK